MAAFGFLFYITDSFWLEYFLTWIDATLTFFYTISSKSLTKYSSTGAGSAARSVITAPAPRSKLITAPSGQQNLTAEKRSFGRNLDVFFKINMQKGTNNILECKQDCALYAATRQIVFYRSIDRFLKSKFGYDNLLTAWQLQKKNVFSSFSNFYVSLKFQYLQIVYCKSDIRLSDKFIPQSIYEISEGI